MKQHITNTRDNLGELAQLSARTDAAERNILRAAQSRLDEVQAMIQRATPGVESAPARSQDRYLELVKERAQLRLIIARAQGVIAG